MSGDIKVDYCSFEAHILGAKFYPRLAEMLLVCEPENMYYNNSIVAKVLDSETMLEHLDWQTTTAIAPLLDNHPGLILKS